MLKNLVYSTLLSAAFSFPLVAQEMVYPDTVIILDSSNSMWGQIRGVSKMQISRDVISELVADLETDSEFGLMAFGHRRKNDCSDIELILPVAPLDPASFSAAVNGLVPHGSTPLTAALEETARLMQSDTRSARIIIISDGVESCDRNLCELSKQLELDGLDFTTHIIGFDVADLEDQSLLSCAADNTGGLYLTAQSTGELKEALEFMMMDEEMDTAATPDPQAWIGGPNEVNPSSEIFINWTGPNEDGDYIALAKSGSPVTSFESIVRTAAGSPQKLVSPEQSGNYELRYISANTGEILATDNIIIRTVN